MFYVIKVTCIGPMIKECFLNEELAKQYVNALSANNAREHYQIAKVTTDTLKSWTYQIVFLLLLTVMRSMLTFGLIGIDHNVVFPFFADY